MSEVIELDSLIVWLPIRWVAVFGNDHPLKVEIGFGNGSFLVEMARKEPNCNFLGLEIYKRGLWKAKKRVGRLGLTNVRLLRAEAEAAIPKLFGSEEVSEVHINFPDPWPKHKHRRRRLIKPEFVKTLYRVLRLGGRVYLTTDWPDYVQEMLQFFQDHGGFKNPIEKGFLSQAPAGRPITKYEQGFLGEGQPVYYLIFEKQVSAGPVERNAD